MDLDPEGSVRLQSVNPQQYLIRKKSARFGTDQVFTSSTAYSIVIVVIVIVVVVFPLSGNKLLFRRSKVVFA
jgi:hypothetical protein